MDKFDQIQNKIAAIIKNSEIKTAPRHSQATREWVLKLFPAASEELQIAALAHDIDRAVPTRIMQEKNESYDDYRSRHAKRSAELITKLMPDFGYNKDSIEKVKHYVEYHEVGGDEETDILRDADSVSYFIDNIEMYIELRGKELTKKKIKYMYQRASKRAQEIISHLDIKPEVNKLIQESLS